MGAAVTPTVSYWNPEDVPKTWVTICSGPGFVPIVKWVIREKGYNACKVRWYRL